MALERHKAKEYALSGPLFLKAYKLSKSPSALWSAGRAFALAADQAKAKSDLDKSLAYREESLAAFNGLIKNHKLKKDRLARVNAEIIQLRIQITEDKRAIASLPPAPPPPPPTGDQAEKQKTDAFPVTMAKPAPANTSPWLLVTTGGALGIAAGVVFGLSQSNLNTLEANLAETKDGLIQTPRDELLEDEKHINFQRHLSLGLGIGAMVAALSGSIWLMNTSAEITPEVSVSEQGAQVVFSGQF